MPFEKSITDSILEHINSQKGAIAEKVLGNSSSSGRADINACFHGRSIRIEVKTPDNKNRASKKQEHNLKKWLAAGSIVMVVYSKDAVKAFLSNLEEFPYWRGRSVYDEQNGCESWMEIPKYED